MDVEEYYTDDISEASIIEAIKEGVYSASSNLWDSAGRVQCSLLYNGKFVLYDNVA